MISVGTSSQNLMKQAGFQLTRIGLSSLCCDRAHVFDPFCQREGGYID
jgi:hypothetical protein